MGRPCRHAGTLRVEGCRICELWAECPEYFALWEDLPRPEVPAAIRDLRAGRNFVLWKDLGTVRRLAAQHGIPFGGTVREAPTVVIQGITMPFPEEPLKLGDGVEAVLNSLGITKERVESWVGGPCGCTERKEKLNALGAWAHRVLSGKVDKAKEYLERLMGSKPEPEP